MRFAYYLGSVEKSHYSEWVDTGCPGGFWPSIFLTPKKYTFLTPEFMYQSSGILSFFLCQHSPRWFFQKTPWIVLKIQKKRPDLEKLQKWFWECWHRKKLNMPHNLYINSGVKNVYFFGVRNIEGQNHSGHPVYSN